MKNIIALFLLFFSFTSFVHAATEQELLDQADARYKQYLAQQQAAREAYAKSQSVAKAAAAAQAVVDNGVVTSNAAMDTVVQGSSMSSKSTVAKAADAAKAAGTMAGRYGKAALRGAPASFLGYAAFEGLMKGIGWLQKEGSQVVIKKPADNSDNSVYQDTSYQCLGSSNHSISSSLVSCAVSYAKDNNLIFDSCGSGSNQVGAYPACGFKYQDGRGTGFVVAIVVSTPSANPPSSPTVPTQDQIQDAIQKYLNEHPNSDITNNIYNASYNYDNTFELSDDQTNLLARQIGQAVIDGLNAAAPSGSSTVSNNDSSGTPQKTTTTIDSTGTTTGSTSTTTTTNPDGTTTTSTTTATSDFPAFCSWATVVCDFIKWMESDPPLEDSTLDIQDKTIDDYVYSDHVVFGKSCPFQTPETATIDLGIGQMTFEKDLTFMCTFADSARPYVIGLGYLGSFLYLLIALRNRNV